MQTDNELKIKEKKSDIENESVNPALLYAKAFIGFELDYKETKEKVDTSLITNEHELKLVNAIQENNPPKFFQLMASSDSKTLSRSDVRILIGEAEDQWGPQWMIADQRPIKETVVPSIPRDDIILGEEIYFTADMRIMKGKYKGDQSVVVKIGPSHLCYKDRTILKDGTILEYKTILCPPIVVFNEARLLTKAYSKHVIGCLGIMPSQDEGEPGNLVLEYAGGGTLYDALKKTPISLSQRLQWAQRVCAAVAYIHSLNIIHRDLKSLNIVIVEDGSLRLIDFTASTDSLEDTKAPNLLLEGTPGWAAPDQAITQAGDVFSLGVIIFEIFTGNFKVPTSIGLQSVSIARQLKEPITCPKDVPFVGQYTFSLCTHLDPSKRPPANWALDQFEWAIKAAYTLSPELADKPLEIPSREQLLKTLEGSLDQKTELKPVTRLKYKIKLLSYFLATTFTDFKEAACSGNSEILFWFCFYQDKKTIQEYIAQALSEKECSLKLTASIQSLVHDYGLNPSSLYAKVKNESVNPALLYAHAFINLELDYKAAKVDTSLIPNEHELKLVNAIQENNPPNFFQLMASSESKALHSSNIRILIEKAEDQWGSQWMIADRRPIKETILLFSRDEIILEKEIARTVSTKVMKGKYKGDSVVVKIGPSHLYYEDRAILCPPIVVLNEARLLTKAASKHVIGCLGIMPSQDERQPVNLLLESVLGGTLPVNLVLEYASGGTLYDALKKTPISLSQQLQWAKQVCTAVAYIHSLDIIHRDLKSSNIVIVDDGSLRLIDFTASTDSPEDTKAPNLILGGTPGWSAPEKGITQAGDVFSLGVVIFEIFTGKFKVPTSIGVQSVSIARQLRDPITCPKDVPFVGQYTFSLCTRLDPGERPPANWARDQFDWALKAAYAMSPELADKPLQIPSRKQLLKTLEDSLDQKTELKPVTRLKYKIKLLSCFLTTTITDFKEAACNGNSEMLFWFCFYQDKKTIQEYIAQALSEKECNPKLITSIQSLVYDYGLNPSSLYAKVKPEIYDQHSQSPVIGNK